MNKLSRRTFGKHILAAGALPLIDARILGAQTDASGIPGTIAGYTPSANEKQLAGKFLATHEKNMSNLRAIDLPNSLAPDILYASPGCNLVQRKGKEK